MSSKKEKKEKKQEETKTDETLTLKKKDSSKAIFKTPKEATVLPPQNENPKVVFKTIQKRKIISKIDYGSLVLREFQNIDCTGAAIYDATPSDNEQVSIGSLVGHFIIEQLELPLIGEFFSRSYNPVSVVERGHSSQFARIYGNKNFVVFTSEFQLSEEGEHDMVDAILDFSARHKCTMIMSVKSLESEPEKKSKYNVKFETPQEDSEGEEGGDEVPQTKEDILKLIEEAKKKKLDERLYFCTNNEDLADKLIKSEHKPIQDVMIAGVAGGLIAEATYQDIPILCLFSPMTELHKFISIDTREGISIVHCINKLFENLKLDITKMNEEATKMEELMKKIIERLGGPGPQDSHLYL